MRLPRLASAFLAVSLLGGAATARPVHHRIVDTVADRAELPLPMPVTDRAAVKTALARRRAQNLKLFRAYYKAGVYPHNITTSGPLNVWLDAEGRLCAAATILAKSGHHDLAMSIGATNNQIRLADVKDGALMDWILTSGFTQAEIDAIQEPFDGPAWYEPTPEQRLAEDRRLRKRYGEVDRMLVKQRARSLDAAVDRLMQHPTLAASLLAG